MTDTYHNQDLPGIGSAAPVKAWQSSVETFFREDWSRLRSLILTLEEDLWLDSDRLPRAYDAAVQDAAAHDLSSASSGRQQTDLVVSHSSASPPFGAKLGRSVVSPTDAQPQGSVAGQPKINSKTPASVESNGDPLAADRLSELAEQLENRLKMMNASKR